MIAEKIKRTPGSLVLIHRKSLETFLLVARLAKWSGPRISLLLIHPSQDSLSVAKRHILVVQDADIVYHLAGITDVAYVKSDMNEEQDRMLENVGVQGSRNSGLSLTLSDAEKLISSNISGVRNIAPQIDFPAQLIAGNYNVEATVFGTTPE